jgi:hypothetical protein
VKRVWNFEFPLQGWTNTDQIIFGYEYGEMAHNSRHRDIVYAYCTTLLARLRYLVLYYEYDDEITGIVPGMFI